jgi:GH25 family lysozyme M1 (1,4-beta-N-acetylmuramidase)
VSGARGITALLIGSAATAAAAQSVGPPLAPLNPTGGDFSRVMIDVAGEDQNRIVDANDPDLKRFGVELIFHRATLGVPPKADDEGFADGIRRIFAKGFRAGAYHVIFPRSDDAHTGSAQADTYFQALAAACKVNPGGAIVTAVDWEPTYRFVSLPGRKKKERVLVGTAKPADVAEFLLAAQQKYGVSPIVYTGTDVLARFRASASDQSAMTQLSSYVLWIATYQQRYYHAASEGTKNDQVVKYTYKKAGASHTGVLEARVGYIFPIREEVQPWADWTFWQYGGGNRGFRDVTSKSRITLGSVAVDMSFFNGTRDEFTRALDANTYRCHS